MYLCVCAQLMPEWKIGRSWVQQWGNHRNQNSWRFWRKNARKSLRRPFCRTIHSDRFCFFCDFFCQKERNTICLSMILIYIYIHMFPLRSTCLTRSSRRERKLREVSCVGLRMRKVKRNILLLQRSSWTYPLWSLSLAALSWREGLARFLSWSHSLNMSARPGVFLEQMQVSCVWCVFCSDFAMANGQLVKVYIVLVTWANWCALVCSGSCIGRQDWQGCAWYQKTVEPSHPNFGGKAWVELQLQEQDISRHWKSLYVCVCVSIFLESMDKYKCPLPLGAYSLYKDWLSVQNDSVTPMCKSSPFLDCR